jgi:hypothetical protein
MPFDSACLRGAHKVLFEGSARTGLAFYLFCFILDTNPVTTVTPGTLAISFASLDLF